MERNKAKKSKGSKDKRTLSPEQEQAYTEAIKYQYTIPSVTELKEDLVKKQGKPGENIAIARLAAVENRENWAIQKVKDHHDRKSIGLYKEDGGYNKESTKFASLYKNKVKAKAWVKFHEQAWRSK